MIAKGAARSGPRQLAVYLMRVEDYATGEPATLLELQSAWAAAPNGTPERTAAKLIEAFRDWQALTEGTKQGRDGLYHAEISPAPEYADAMTPEQWKRAADLLGEELGLQNQPRAIVLHGGTDGRKHLHVVWARTDVDEMKLISDSYNYIGHERASKRMELEFGHEFVPGKHAKRDREQQPEFPRQDFDYAEAQMSERSPLSVAERKEQIRALQAASANGEEFKKALEDAGYVLAQGERGYIVVDQEGVHSTLPRNLRGVMDKAQVEAFMQGVALDQLPTIEEAQALQADRALKAREAERASLPPEMTTAERREQITGIRKSCDDAQAFRHALEESGYVLAQGNRGGYVVVDEQGKAFSLFTHLADVKRKEYKAFMAPVELASLPDIEQAKAIQQERAAKARDQGVEASKFVTPEVLEKIKAPAPTAPEPVSKFLPQLEAPVPSEPTAGPETQGKPSKDQPYNWLKYAFLGPRKPIPHSEAPEATPQPPTPSASAEPPSKFLPQPEASAPTAPSAGPEAHGKPPEQDPYAWVKYAFIGPKKPIPHHEATEATPPTAPSESAVPPSKFLPQPMPSAHSEPTPVAPQPPAAPPQPPVHIPQPPADWTEQELKSKFQDLQPKPAPVPETKREFEDPEITKLKKAVWKRQQIEYQKWADLNALEYKRKDVELRNQNANKIEDFDLAQNAAMGDMLDNLTELKKGVWGVDSMNSKLNPVEADEKAQARQIAIAQLRATQKKERDDYIKLIEQSRQTELESLREKHLAEQKGRETKYNEELDRFVKERRAALKLKAELEADEKARKESGWAEDFKKEQEYPWDDFPEDPKKGK